MERIENLSAEQLAEALEYNGYSQCVDVIRTKCIDGEEFLKLTELQIVLWRLQPVDRRRLWSFLQHVRENPKNFTFKPNVSKPSLGIKPCLLNVRDKVNESGSSLTKEEATSIKNKLEEAFKSSGTVTNPSFLHTKKLPLPPKPNFSSENIQNLDENYLSPIKFPEANAWPQPPQITNNVLPFLNKTTYKNRKPEVKQRNNAVCRPLPSIPIQQNDHEDIYTPVEDEIEEAEYIPVLDDTTHEFDDARHASFQRPLPPIPFQQLNYEDDEDLAEYGVIVEDNVSDDNDGLPNYLPMLGNIRNNQLNVKSLDNSARRPLPPIPKRSFTSRNVNDTKYASSDSEDDTILKEMRKPPRSIASTTQHSLSFPQTRSKSTSPSAKPKSETNAQINRKQNYDFTKESCYRETDRKGAKILLNRLENGTFLIRPSRDPKYMCTFSIMHTIKMLNYGVERDNYGFLSLTSTFTQPKFNTISEMINFYKMHPLTIADENVTLKMLPTNRR